VKHLALAVVVSTGLVLDFLANKWDVQSHGWDVTATWLIVLAIIAWVVDEMKS